MRAIPSFAAALLTVCFISLTRAMPQRQGNTIVPTEVSGKISAKEQQRSYLTAAYRRGAIKLVPIVTIDETTLPKNVFFQRPKDIKCDLKGNVYISDSQAGQVYKFDANGKFLMAIGRRGQGPGEFQMPDRIAVTGDRLFVYDVQNLRICALTLEGVFINSIPIAVGFGDLDDMKGLPSGDVVVGLVKSYIDDWEKPQEYTLRLLSPDLEFGRTIYNREIWRSKYARFEGKLTSILMPFSPVVSWDISPEGKIIIGFQKAYEIEIHDPHKGKIASFLHEYEPVKITELDKELFSGDMARGLTTPAAKRWTAWRLKTTEFPKEKPPFFNLLADADGYILVFPHRKLRDEEMNMFDVFTPSGQYLGPVNLKDIKISPRSFAVWEQGFWMIRIDSDGLPRIVKYLAIN